jgi:hypothetical protein
MPSETAIMTTAKRSFRRKRARLVNVKFLLHILSTVEVTEDFAMGLTLKPSSLVVSQKLSPKNSFVRSSCRLSVLSRLLTAAVSSIAHTLRYRRCKTL